MTTAARVTTSAGPAQFPRQPKVDAGTPSEGNDPLHMPDELDQDDITAEKMGLACPVCYRPVPPKKTRSGRPRIYCSPRCRDRAHVRRQRRVPIHDRRFRRLPARRPLPDAAHDAGWKLRRAVERIEQIIADDRLGANREKVAVHLDGHLSYAADTCARMISQLHQEG